MAFLPCAAACYSGPRKHHEELIESSSSTTANVDNAQATAAGAATGGASGSGGSSAGGGNSSTGLGLGGFGGIASGGTGGTGSDDSNTSGSGAGPAAACADLVAEALPARPSITSLEGAPSSGATEQILTITKGSLFREFARLGCGVNGCHGGADEPFLESPSTFKVTEASFGQRPNLGTLALERILSSDPSLVMPPGAGDGSQLADDAPLRVFAERMLTWEEKGYPDKFDVVVELGDVGQDLPDDPYLLSPDLGAKLSNIGSCLPHTSFLALDSDAILKSEMQAKDALFESLESSSDLPDFLVETDLVSIDSAVLARRGVYSYAPTYTLFSDHAGKMRHLRVPVGETIRFNPQTQDFDIPDNTRFYKTFLKQVIDENGELGWRKMETRLIVVRRDAALPGGGYRPRALRTTYAWDKDERMARRVTDPLRNGEPFADRLCPYVVDESTPRDPEENPILEPVNEHCEYMTEEEIADPHSGRIRHYGIPSTQRCDQCHMGSHNRSYILGFTPWQVDRRPLGKGGVYEAATQQELGQLARLIAYGVITGIAPGDAKLEESQGDRIPRNDYELIAQAYMMGNCVFCHNPNGFPVVENPLLAPFDLYPSEEGGVFQFPLEKYSPRAKAGPAQDVRFPYITAHFGDHDIVAQTEGDTKKAGEEEKHKDLYWGFPETPPVVDFDPLSIGEDEGAPVPPDIRIDDGVWLEFLGPWRSLIWRNVYTPFTYDEDYTIFVHMPRNAPGYDCRAHNIMADWMLSIPTVEKADSFKEDQPVQEVLPDEPGYAEAMQQALQRVEDFHVGITGQHCPIDDDIVDPKVVLSPLAPNSTNKLTSSPMDDGVINSPRVANDLPLPLLDQVPDHAHWVPTDTTDPPGSWVPRRPNWAQLIATRTADPGSAKLERVIDQLGGVHLSPEQEAFALEALPLGLWATVCQETLVAAGSPTVAELEMEPDAPMQRWLAGVFKENDPGVTNPSAKVHFQSRGEAVFKAICQNCHGREADSRSPLAATILELTGGQTRVANFIDGLFGPREAPGAFARDEFLINNGATPADWQVRYMLFMGLGGTLAEIPRSVLDLVAVSPFYGQPVTSPGTSDPNMLDSAVQLCGQFLGHERILLEDSFGPRVLLDGTAVTFARGAAHYELWESLCTFDNDPVVFVFPAKTLKANSGTVYRARDDSGNWIYSPELPVGNQHAGIDIGIHPENTVPWCIRLTDDGSLSEAELASERGALVAKFSDWGFSESEVPICPAALFAKALGQQIHKLALTSQGILGSVALGNQAFSERWMRRGAMNAGTAAYYYLNGLTRGQLEPAPPFDACGGD